MHHEHDHPPGAVNLPDVDPLEFDRHPHAFIMVGAKALFGCHMTSLWMRGHTYEIVLRLHVPYDVMELYLAARKAPVPASDQARLHAPQTCFLTCFPEPFALPEVKLARRSFRGQMNKGFPKQFEGWPWSKETPLADGFPVEIERVVQFRHFDFGMGRPREHTYTLFGEYDEAHLCHHQTTEPDTDHVATLRTAPDWLHAERLRGGVHVSFPDLPGDKTLCVDPFATQHSWRVRYQGTGPDRPLTIDTSHWFSTLVTNRPNASPCGPAQEPAPAPSHAHPTDASTTHPAHAHSHHGDH